MMTRLLNPLICLALALWCAAPAMANDAPLPPAEAFKYRVSHDANGSLIVDWDLHDGYYLYQRKLSFASDPGGAVLGEASLPDGLDHEDEYFGKQTIYRDRFRVTIPYNSGGPTSLKIRSQGCADLGICYPPQTFTADINLPSVAASAMGQSTKVLDATNVAANATLLNVGESEFLPPFEAFKPLVAMLDGQTLELAWQIEPGYYLYRDHVKVESLHAAVQPETPLPLPAGKKKFDEYFGETEVYYDGLVTNVDISYLDDETTEFTLALAYQGCAEDGICYPPLKRYVEVNLRRLEATVLAPDAPRPQAGGIAAQVAPEPATAANSAARLATTEPAAKVSVQDQLAGKIRDGSIFAVMGLFFVAGLALALTPCVLPMIPILSGIIAGDGDKTTPLRGFSLALTYVLGMALTYTIAGALFAMAGQQAQAFFQKPEILIGFAGLFVVLAISMFGAFELQMPSAIQTRLATMSGQQKSGTFVGAFIMGALSSLIVTACVAPPLIAALTVIGQTGDVVRGGLALFSLSMGMGAPLLLVGASAGKLIPKAGAWMEAVKIGFGFVMLALAVYILDRLLPPSLTLALWGILLITAAVYFGGLDTLQAGASGRQRVAKGFGLVGLVYGASLLLGALTGGTDPLRPLTFAAGSKTEQAETKLAFQPVQSLAELDSALAQAAARGQPVMLDFYADWCVSCKEMEKYTFTDSAVKSALSNTLLLKADVTANNADHIELLQRFKLYGPPSIIFFDQQGIERPPYQVVGMMWPDEFVPHVQAVVGPG